MLLRVLAFAFLTAFCSLAVLAAPSPDPIQVMILGSYHMGNPGQDLHNAKVDDVRTPAKQAELADVAARLARFKPTKIAVEANPERADFGYAKYESFTPEMLTQKTDERVQIGFRLAHKLGLKIVYAIDEQSETVDYFPFDKVEAYAREHGQAELLARLHAGVEAQMKSLESAQKTTPIRLLLANMNDPARLTKDNNAFYYGLLSLGDQTVQPGADLNAAWYLRNAKIFAKLTQVAKPGDRIIVLFGAGHAYWLRQLVQNTPGFVLVEPNKFLR
jgi:Family of unknown function (DUF5694)